MYVCACIYASSTGLNAISAILANRMIKHEYLRENQEVNRSAINATKINID